jgi:hypothetical protein
MVRSRAGSNKKRGPQKCVCVSKKWDGGGGVGWAKTLGALDRIRILLNSHTRTSTPPHAATHRRVGRSSEQRPLCCSLLAWGPPDPAGRVGRV